MKKIVLVAFVLVLFLSTVFGSCFSPLLAENPEIKIYVDPPMSTASLGETFNITINIKHAENVYSWQFSLSWDSTVLNVTNVQEGFFLNQHIYATIFQSYINNDAGNVTVVSVLQGEPRSSSANGNGTLASVTFYVKDDGYTALHLNDTMLLDYDTLELSHATEDGIIPEFPTSTPILLMLTVLTVAIVIHRKRLHKTPTH